MIQLCHQIIHQDLGGAYFEMNIKTINNKIEQNKAQFDLDRQTAKSSALSSRNISKYEFLTGKYVLPEKHWLQKAAALKRFEISPLGKKLKVQTSVTEKQYQMLDKVFQSNKKKKMKNALLSQI